MFETIKNALRNKDIRKKLLFTLFILFIFRLGCYIPVPGLNITSFQDVVNQNDFLQLMSGITGNALANGTLFALGIGPYINASIIIQLLTVGIPYLERLSKQGEEGRKKNTFYTRILTIVLAVVQSVGIIVNFANSSGSINTGLFFGSVWFAGIFMTVVYTAGAMLVMWLGERITDYGIGNGISMIIFIGIISTGGLSILTELEGLATAEYAQHLLSLGIFIVLTVILFFCIVYVDLAERRIPVQYAKQVRGTKMYGGQSSVIPMKITGSGVMPLIFAFAILSFPSMIISLFVPESNPAHQGLAEWFSGSSQFWYGRVIYSVALCLLIFAFAFFYAQIEFNPDDVAKQIQSNGGFIQGIRPGKPTAQYLRKINKRITLFGAIFLTLVAFIPSVAFSWTGSQSLVNVFSTTGILIIVSVALEFDKQLQSQIMMKTYKGFLK